MDFSCDHIKSELILLFLLIAGTGLVQAIQPSGMLSSDIQPVHGVKGRCELKDIVTSFAEIDGNVCSSSINKAENLYHYLIIVQNRCKYCNANGVGVKVSGYFLGNEILNLTRSFAPGGDQYVIKYTNSEQVGGVSPSSSAFYECRDL